MYMYMYILKGIPLHHMKSYDIVGCGKTTFLDLLAGRRNSGSFEGSIYVNGRPLQEVRDWYIARTGYVLQLATPYYPELTVRENLTLCAQIRLPKSYSITEKLQRVEQIIREVRGERERGREREGEIHTNERNTLPHYYQ